MALRRLEFGYHPEQFEINAGPISVQPLAGIAERVRQVEASDGIANGWIYAQPQNKCCAILDNTHRIFGLPKTHVLIHEEADTNEHVAFHIWPLSFFIGLRLTPMEAGFLDATPLKPGSLVDFVPSTCSDLTKSVELAEDFWSAHRSSPDRARWVQAIIHTLFLGQNPRNLQFESFLFLYTAFDACFKLASSLQTDNSWVRHSDRIKWLCDQFGIRPPAWSTPSGSAESELVKIRNLMVHEALFMGNPLGFGLHGIGTDTNLILEMQALLCRFVVTLLGGGQTDYVQLPINTRQKFELKLT